MKLASSHDEHRKRGTYRRGEEARARILAVAIEEFGRNGFEQAATRAIAARAGVNLGSLNYYFGSKEQLYRACAEHIAESVQPRLDALIEMSTGTAAISGKSRDDRRQTLERFLGAAIDRLLIPGSSSWLMFINREQMSPGAAFEILYERVVGRLLAAVSLLISPLVGEAPDSETVTIQAVALLGPLFIYQRVPAVALRALKWEDFSGERLSKVKDILVRQTLDGLFGTRPESCESPKTT